MKKNFYFLIIFFSLVIIFFLFSRNNNNINKKTKTIAILKKETSSKINNLPTPTSSIPVFLLSPSIFVDTQKTVFLSYTYQYVNKDNLELVIKINNPKKIAIDALDLQIIIPEEYLEIKKITPLSTLDFMPRQLIEKNKLLVTALAFSGDDIKKIKTLNTDADFIKIDIFIKNKDSDKPIIINLDHQTTQIFSKGVNVFNDKKSFSTIKIR